MKILFTLLAAVLLTATIWAQTPQSFKYQAVARDASGEVVTDQAIGMQISILQSSTSGTAVYVETFTPTTNGFGLITLNIGAGTWVSGDFTTIDWSADTYFIKIEMDITGGTTYEEYGTSQLLSVPYALHAKTAENLTGTVIETDPLFTGWDKSAGISITETQISDLNHTVDTDTHIDSTGIAGLGFVAGAHTVETDPEFTAWDKSTGISIKETQISDLNHTVDTDTHIDSTGIAGLGFVAGAHTIDTDDQTLSLSNDTLYIMDGNNVYIGGNVADTDWDTIGNYVYNVNDSIGIGTATPSSKLEVAGDIKLDGGLQAVGGGEKLRILSGLVSSDGSSNLPGYTSTRNSAGSYTITYSTPFSGIAIPVASTYNDRDNIIHIDYFSSTSFRVLIYDGPEFTDEDDCVFLFIVVGVR